MKYKMIKPVILVLEDTSARVKWLEHFFGQRYEVLATDSVREFLKLHAWLEDEEALLIMDHDLGLSVYAGEQFDGFDADGLNGFDAACLVRTTKPVLVWSLNGKRAPQMLAKLRQRGIDAVWEPHDDTNTIPLRNTLQQLLDTEV